MAALIPFYDWLAKQKSLRTSLGGFARDAARDPSFPREVKNWEELLEYLRASAHGSAQTVAVARSAYRAYERAHNVAPRA